MTEKDSKQEPEIAVNAVPLNEPSHDNGAAPIPPGHARFYCHKCHAVRTTKSECVRVYVYNVTSVILTRFFYYFYVWLALRLARQGHDVAMCQLFHIQQYYTGRV